MDIPDFINAMTYRYDVASFVGYHQQVFEVVDGYVEDVWTAMHISTDEKAKWKGYIDLMTELNRETTASDETWESDRQNEERRRIARLLNKIITSEKRTISAEYAAAARVLDTELGPYKDLPEVKDNDFTSLMEGFEKDCEKEEVAEAIELFGLNDWINRMIAASDAFKLAKLRRLNEKAARDSDVTISEIRDEVDAFVESMFRRISSSAVVCDDPEKQADMVSIIEQINTLGENYKTSCKQSEAQRKKDKDDESEDSEKPEKPEEKPDEPKEPEEPEKPTDPEEGGDGNDKDDEEGGTHFEPVDPDDEKPAEEGSTNK